MNATRSGLFLAVLFIAGCEQSTDISPRATNKDAVPQPIAYDATWNERNADIYRFLLAELDKPEPDRIYFITTTPMAEWGEAGAWEKIPAVELKAFANAAQYRSAQEAHLKDGRVLETGTDAAAWMQWISVKRWLSATEVEVEEGVWCCPLGGGASTTIYEKIDGKWRVKKYGEFWVS